MSNYMIFEWLEHSQVLSCFRLKTILSLAGSIIEHSQVLSCFRLIGSQKPYYIKPFNLWLAGASSIVWSSLVDGG